jgi:hypothetical protein
MSHVHAEAVKNIKNATVAKQEKIRFQRWQKRRYSKIASPAEACKEIFEALYGTIIRPAVTDVLNKELSSMGVDLDALGQDEIKKLGETIGKEKGLDDIGNKVKGMFGN